MSQTLNPYILFRGQAADAIAFYASVFGGEPSIGTFSGFGMPVENEAEKDWVMHAQLDTPAGFTLMVSDVPSSMPDDTEGAKISISLSGDDEPELRGYYDGLVAGATASRPLEKAPWGDTYGELTDEFGVRWLFNIAGEPNS